MSKTKKKRNKVYRGQDAAMKTPNVTRVSVPDRSRLASWWVENKKVLRIRAIITSVLLGFFILFYLLFTWIF